MWGLVLAALRSAPRAQRADRRLDGRAQLADEWRDGQITLETMDLTRQNTTGLRGLVK